MKRRGFDHIDLRVSDIAAAQRFYSQLLPALGFTVDPVQAPRAEMDQVDQASGDVWCIWETPGQGPVEFFGLTEKPKHRPNDSRIAFWAESRAEVDRIAEIVRQAGGMNLEGPALCREYSPGYYAVFFEDPSGNKLEVCCRQSLVA